MPPVVPELKSDVDTQYFDVIDDEKDRPESFATPRVSGGGRGREGGSERASERGREGGREREGGRKREGGREKGRGRERKEGRKGRREREGENIDN